MKEMILQFRTKKRKYQLDIYADRVELIDLTLGKYRVKIYKHTPTLEELFKDCVKYEQ